jgi:predicted dehydrogenase
MPERSKSQPPYQANRRDFLKTSTVMLGGALAGGLAIGRAAHAAGSDVLNVGLIGCGGRGTGAAVNALTVDENTRLTALADPFPEKMQNCLNSIQQRFGDRVTADASHCFGGFDGYQKLIESGVDVVILATPPHFRPVQLKAAVDAGRHVFCEKPVAVDAPGVRSVLATCEEAGRKNLSVVSGLCWRYHHGVKETMNRVLDGAIGDLISIQETYLTGFLWHRGREPDDTEMKYQMRNWYYFTWLSGDHNVEQHVHSLDKALWVMGDEPPVRAWGLGGRQVRTEAMWGDIYDHHAVAYEYPNNVTVFAYTRQQGGTYRDVSDHFYGTKGHADILKHRIDGENEWRFQGEGGNMYELEHQALFQSIRAAQPINNGVYMARSTMLAILGRMVNYTGQAITWDQALNSQESLAPASYSWDAEPPTMPDAEGRYPIAMPGVTKFV